VGPCSIGEGGNLCGGVGRVVIDANATLIGSNAKFVDNGHVSGDGEIVLDDGVESRRG